jgi:hypothetical protein
MLFPERLAVKPEAPPLLVPAKEDAAATTEVTPLVLNSSKPFELVIENVFFVPVSDFTIKASPPLPVVSTVLASAPEILFISFIRPWTVLLPESIVIVLVTPFITKAIVPVLIEDNVVTVPALTLGSATEKFASVRSKVTTCPLAIELTVMFELTSEAFASFVTVRPTAVLALFADLEFVVSKVVNEVVRVSRRELN